MAFGSQANAGLIYDLRFSDGSHSVAPVAGQTYTLQLWGRVSGTNAMITDEGLNSGYVNIVSTQSGGGAITAGGLTAGVRVAPFAGAGSRDGSPADLNADGILDWGSTSTAIANTNYMFTRTDTVGGELAGGTIGQSFNGGWEFKLASFTVTANAVGTGTTTFNIVKPNATSFVAVIYAVSKIDGSTVNVTSSNQQGAYAASTGATLVTGIIPEPASVGLLGTATLGLLGRRRKA